MASNKGVQLGGLSTATGTIGGSKHQQPDNLPMIHQIASNGSVEHNGSNCVNTRPAIAVNGGSNCILPSKSSAREKAAREKALQEIRISLQPFANHERPTSSASSTSDSSSSPRQTSGIGSSISSNYSAIAFNQSRRNSANSTSNGNVNNAIQTQLLMKQLQNISLVSSNCHDPQQVISYPQSPASFTSLYSSISSPPSHAASSSSGRQSPTPTISSSEYSVPPLIRSNAHLQLQKKLSSASSTRSSSSHTPISSSHTPISISGNLPNRPVQAWTARQAISQSPVIMQSVKSTQVKKPVLQTAVAPTTPPLNSNFTNNNLVTQPKPNCQQTSSAESSCKTSACSNSNSDIANPSNTNNNILKNPPPYPFNNQKFNGQLSSFHPQIQECLPVNPPPSYASAMQQQQQQQQKQFQMQQQTQLPQIQHVNLATPESTNPTRSSSPPPPPPPPYFSPTTVSRDPKIISVLSQYDNDFTNGSVQVPTTEPPSYAFSVAALAAQRAGLTTCSNADSSCSNVSVTSSRSSNFNNLRLPSRPPPTPPRNSDLVNTVESICSSQISALQGVVGTSVLNGRRTFDDVPPLPPKPNTNQVPLNTCTCMAESTCGSECSTESSNTGSQSTNGQSGFPDELNSKTTHHSPIPPRKQLSKEKEKERRESKVRNYSPAAFKFFMEQHMENVLKSHQQREKRRQQLEAEMAKVGLTEEAQSQMRKMLHQKESNYIRLRRAKMERSMFKKIKTIGVGAFGEVALVKKNGTNQLYAMKTLRKSDVLKRNQVAHVKAERDILAEADNEWVVKLYYSFQDEDNLYFVMDYIPGGDLMSLLIKFGIFQEPLARFYIAELVLAVESVHKMGFIHRDIKPDNILIDRDGHIKLTDFGLCTGFHWTHNSKYYQRNNGIDVHNRQDSLDLLNEHWSKNTCHCNSASKPLERRRRRQHQRCLAHSLVGTPNYIAPEVLMRTGYTQLCDWWSVGVILYEMLVGQPPFFANTPEETQNKVIHWDKTLRIPKEAKLSASATDLILRLCCGPEDRLGKNGVDEIKKHSFFANIDFDSQPASLRRQPAPYIPEIKYPTDTSNFDPIDTEKLHPSASDDSSGIFCQEKYNYVNAHEQFQENGKHPEHAFFEFTFRRFFDDGGQSYPFKIVDLNVTNNNTNTNDNGQGSPVYV